MLRGLCPSWHLEGNSTACVHQPVKTNVQICHIPVPFATDKLGNNQLRYSNKPWPNIPEKRHRINTWEILFYSSGQLALKVQLLDKKTLNLLSKTLAWNLKQFPLTLLNADARVSSSSAIPLGIHRILPKGVVILSINCGQEPNNY